MPGSKAEAAATVLGVGRALMSMHLIMLKIETRW